MEPRLNKRWEPRFWPGPLLIICGWVLACVGAIEFVRYLGHEPTPAKIGPELVNIFMGVEIAIIRARHLSRAAQILRQAPRHRQNQPPIPVPAKVKPVPDRAPMRFLVAGVTMLTVALALWFTFGHAAAPAEKDAWSLVVAFEAATGTVLTGFGLYRLQLARRFGTPVLRLVVAPVGPGETLEGNIHFPASLGSKHKGRLRIQCIRTTMHPVWQRITRQVLWSETKQVPVSPSTETGFKSAFPVRFNLPEGCPETDDSWLLDQIKWLLEVRLGPWYAPVKATFELPVFSKWSAPEPASSPSK